MCALLLPIIDLSIRVHWQMRGRCNQLDARRLGSEDLGLIQKKILVLWDFDFNRSCEF